MIVLVGGAFGDFRLRSAAPTSTPRRAVARASGKFQFNSRRARLISTFILILLLIVRNGQKKEKSRNCKKGSMPNLVSKLLYLQ